MCSALAMLDDDTSESGSGTLILLVVIALVIALFVIAQRGKRRRIETWLGSLEFCKQALLPEDLKPSQSAWQAMPETRRIFAGSYAGFACVLFEIGQGTGDTRKWLSVVAVMRSTGGPLLARAVEELGATLDQTSTPGWLLASVPGANAEQQKLEPLLRLLTRESWSGLID